MNDHDKKMIAPIVITILLVSYLLIYLAAAIITMSVSFVIFGGIFALIAAAGIILSIYTLIDRIREIEKGEEDDLSKY